MRTRGGPRFGFGQPVTRIRPVPRNAFGDRPAGAPADARAALGLGAFAPSTSTEDTLTRGDTVATSGTVYLPHGSDVRATDRLEIGADVWEVDGDPADWSSPLTGTQGPMEVRVRKVTG
jgi:hypothetical protein